MATLTISPLEEKRVKAMGFLSNKGTDNFSARIITVNGKITAEQQKVIAEAAEKFGNGIITFTTRLTIEVQGVPFDQIEAFQEYIAKAGLKTGGTSSCGLLQRHHLSVWPFGFLRHLRGNSPSFLRGLPHGKTTAQVQNRRGRMSKQLCKARSE